MKLIRAGSGHDIHNGAAAIAELRPKVGLLDPELVNRFDRGDIESLLHAGIVVAVHDADTIQQHVRLGVPASVGDKVCDEARRAGGVSIRRAGGL